MAKLYFKYGAMGSSKSAQALMTKFNYEEKDRKVWLIKPSIDTRDGSDTVYSRIGLSAKAQVISPQDDIYEMFGEKCRDADVVISDESQFFTEDQIDQLRRIVDECDIPVLCFGLRTDFLTHLKYIVINQIMTSNNKSPSVTLSVPAHGLPATLRQVDRRG